MQRLRPIATCAIAGLFAVSLLVAPTYRNGSADAAAPTMTMATVGATCMVDGAATPTGSNLISGPMLPQITGSALPITLPTSVVRTAEVNPGGAVTSTVTIQLDLSTVADDVLTKRVQPGVVGARYPHQQALAKALGADLVVKPD